MSMAAPEPLPPINIRPGVGVYATYRRLSYRPWNAIAEFVDNSTQSYFDNRDELRRVFRQEQPNHLRIGIDYDDESNSLTITDNAHGIGVTELFRALALDKPPPNTAGRCEFGMGLKTAACWFGRTWSIRSVALGSAIELRARVHIPDLVEGGHDEIPVQAVPAEPPSHFTAIKIEGLYKPIRGRTAGRIKDQLGSMYRVDLRSGEVEILWNGEPVAFEEPPILEEKLDDNSAYRWRRDISFTVPWEEGKHLPVTGWVGLRYPGSQRDAGFALLRRGRVVVGGPGEGYKPTEIFGQGNTFRSQRLVGELNMDQWPVTQAKDAFDWSGGLEDELIQELRNSCHDLMEKAEGFRMRDRPVQLIDMQLAAEPTQHLLEAPEFVHAIIEDLTLPEPAKTLSQETLDTLKLRHISSGPIIYTLNSQGLSWTFQLHWQDSISDSNWMSLSLPDEHTIDIFLNTGHPFFAAYLDRKEFLELIQRLVISLALAEKMARRVHPDGRVDVSDFRMYMNRVLRHVGDLEHKDVT